MNKVEKEANKYTFYQSVFHLSNSSVPLLFLLAPAWIPWFDHRKIRLDTTRMEMTTRDDVDDVYVLQHNGFFIVQNVVQSAKAKRGSVGSACRFFYYYFTVLLLLILPCMESHHIRKGEGQRGVVIRTPPTVVLWYKLNREPLFILMGPTLAAATRGDVVEALFCERMF